ncbi:hypothetical protein K505DRAFT_53769 [Melanomma pulvis-pyrius CBS 109.77]|uniref:Uncharacterized protein n=1 Tax=Melanomma pulvis-pyrius CBS 109.77 TaxID=1314802 RepID=A0A6A6X807_9PLEO|nr:hypothetical protein K505DRAFT_53769 [Melanomma pulvis-pyrius CBS 109.77]
MQACLISASVFTWRAHTTFGSDGSTVVHPELRADLRRRSMQPSQRAAHGLEWHGARAGGLVDGSGGRDRLQCSVDGRRRRPAHDSCATSAPGRELLRGPELTSSAPKHHHKKTTRPYQQSTHPGTRVPVLSQSFPPPQPPWPSPHVLSRALTRAALVLLPFTPRFREMGASPDIARVHSRPLLL